MKMITKYFSALPTRWVSVLAGVFSLLLGAWAALVLYYVLYRISLPSTPFIYVAF